MTTMRIKEWKMDEINASAYDYGYEIETLDTIVKFGGGRYHVVEIEEVIKETEKAVNVSIKAVNYKGYETTWKTWIPKSAIWEAEEKAEEIESVKAETAEQEIEEQTETNTEVETEKTTEDNKMDASAVKSKEEKEMKYIVYDVMKKGKGNNTGGYDYSVLGAIENEATLEQQNEMINYIANKYDLRYKSKSDAECAYMDIFSYTVYDSYNEYLACQKDPRYTEILTPCGAMYTV